VLSLAATGLSCFIISVLSWIYMLKPATVYDYDDDQQNTLENDALLVLIGGFIMLTFTPFTLGKAMISHDFCDSTLTLPYYSSLLLPCCLALLCPIPSHCSRDQKARLCRALNGFSLAGQLEANRRIICPPVGVGVFHRGVFKRLELLCALVLWGTVRIRYHSLQG
jgi:hypothetical protein